MSHITVSVQIFFGGESCRISDENESYIYNLYLNQN